MVSSIPPPLLNDLLPPFLSHIPASFTSPKPPPSLPPLLTPLTRSRLTHLAFNLSSVDSSFLALLTWSSNPSDGQSLHEHLGSQDYYFLHQPPSPNTFQLRGYRRLDGETIQTLTYVPELEIVVVYQFTADDIINEAGSIGDAWKVHDVRLSDDEEELSRGGEWYSTIELAEEKFRERAHLSVGFHAIGGGQAQEAEEDDDDDYWGRYDEEDTESSAGDQESRAQPVSQQQSPVQIAANLLARRVLQDQPDEEKEEDEYYSRYANVEPVLDQGPSGAERSEDRRDSISTMHTSTSNYENPTTLSTPLTMFTQPSTTVSPTITNNKVHNVKTKDLTTQGSKVVELENAAQVHTQNEVAIKQHVSTSIKSLYRLWKAGGMDGEDFGTFLEREVEVLQIVEDADGGLGS